MEALAPASAMSLPSLNEQELAVLRHFAQNEIQTPGFFTGSADDLAAVESLFRLGLVEGTCEAGRIGSRTQLQLSRCHVSPAGRAVLDENEPGAVEAAARTRRLKRFVAIVVSLGAIAAAIAKWRALFK